MIKKVKLASFRLYSRSEAPKVVEVENIETFPGMGTPAVGLLCLYGSMEASEEIKYRHIQAEKKKKDYYSITIEMTGNIGTHEYIDVSKIRSGENEFLIFDRFAPDAKDLLLKTWRNFLEEKKRPIEITIGSRQGAPILKDLEFLGFLLEQNAFKRAKAVAGRFDVGSRLVKYALLRNDTIISGIECFGPNGTVPAILPERMRARGGFSRQQLMEAGKDNEILRQALS